MDYYGILHIIILDGDKTTQKQRLSENLEKNSYRFIKNYPNK